jgi:hypothetical protein
VFDALLGAHPVEHVAEHDAKVRTLLLEEARDGGFGREGLPLRVDTREALRNPG